MLCKCYDFYHNLFINHIQLRYRKKAKNGSVLHSIARGQSHLYNLGGHTAYGLECESYRAKCALNVFCKIPVSMVTKQNVCQFEN